MADLTVDRRGFVKVGALVGAGTAAGVPDILQRMTGAWPGVRSEGAIESIRLGVASYSLRKFPRAVAIEMIKTLGARHVNVKSVHMPYDAPNADLQAARREFEAAELQIVGGGTITFSRNDDADVKKYFDYAKACGMPLMTITADREILPRIERFAKEYDIKIAIHNHGPEDKRYPSPYDALKAVEGMDPRMGLCIDVGHTVRTGTDVVRAIADAGARLHDLHLKDLRDLKGKDTQCIVGEGAIPIAEIFRQLQAIRFAGYANLEYEIDADDPMPGMHRSFAYMRGVIAGLGAGDRRQASQ